MEALIEIYDYLYKDLGIILWFIIFGPPLLSFVFAIIMSIGNIKKTKNNIFSLLCNFFGDLISGSFAFYYILIALLCTLATIFASWTFGATYLGSNFQSYPWKFFGMMYDFWGIIFLTFLSCFLSYIFWGGIAVQGLKLWDKVFKKL